MARLRITADSMNHPMNTGRKVQFAVPVGDRTVIAPRARVTLTAPARIAPFVLEWLYVRNNWTPPRLPIWWRFGLLVWFMRRVLKKHRPVHLPPIDFHLHIRGEVVAAGRYMPERQFAEVVRLDQGPFQPMYLSDPCGGPALVIEPYVAVEVTLVNLSDKPLEVAANVGGWSVR